MRIHLLAAMLVATSASFAASAQTIPTSQAAAKNQAVAITLEIGTNSPLVRVDLIDSQLTSQEFRDTMFAELRHRIGVLTGQKESDISLRIQEAMQDHNGVVYWVIATFADPASMGDGVARELAGDLQTKLQKIDVDYQKQQFQERVPGLRISFEVAQSRKNELTVEIQKTRDQLRQLDVTDLNPFEIARMAQQLDEQRQQTAIEIAARQARIDSVKEALDYLSAQATKRAKDDPISAELQKLVDLSEEKVAIDTARYKAAAINQSEVLADQTELTNAKIRLLERQEAISQPAEGNKVSGLQEKLFSLQADLAEAEARVKAIEKLAKQSAVAQDLATKLQDAQQALSKAAAEVHDRSDNLEQALRAEFKPSTYVIVRSVDETRQ